MSVTTQQAAEITGIGYQGFRTMLKRGLGRNAGVLVPFYRADAPAVELYAKRWTWKRFGPGDLAIFRLAKMLMDSGCSFDCANYIASDNHSLWKYLAADDVDGDWFLAYFAPDNAYTIYNVADVPKLSEDLRLAPNAVTVINLGAVRRHVADALQVALA